MTLNQIASNIRNMMRGGRSSNDDLLSLDQIKHLIKYYRALLIRRDQERNLNRSDSFEQDLGYIVLNHLDSAEHLNISSGESVYKSEKKIPKPIRLKNKEAITYIAMDNKVGTPIPMLDAVRSPWQKYNKYTSDNTFAFVRDQHLYVSGDFFSDRVYVRGIFEDPEEVFEFTNENGLELYDDNSDYPIPSDMVENITKSIISGEGKFLLGTPNDNELDRDSQ